MQLKSEVNRYVRMTDRGRDRLEAARRRYRKTLEDVANDSNAPSINTVKRVFRQGPVFVSTLERIWDFFRRCAAEQKERLPYLIEDEDYSYVENDPPVVGNIPGPELSPGGANLGVGWLS